MGFIYLSVALRILFVLRVISFASFRAWKIEHGVGMNAAVWPFAMAKYKGEPWNLRQKGSNHVLEILEIDVD